MSETGIFVCSRSRFASSMRRSMRYLFGGGKMRIEGFFTEAVGATRNISKTIAELKKKGVLTQDNRSNGENIFESSTKDFTWTWKNPS